MYPHPHSQRQHLLCQEILKIKAIKCPPNCTPQRSKNYRVKLSRNDAKPIVEKGNLSLDLVGVTSLANSIMRLRNLVHLWTI